MRLLTVLCAVLLLSGLALGQAPVRGIAGYCPYYCGPYIPLITTPMVSLQTASLAPVGATNATGGLVAGATNSTLSMISGSPDAVYTQPVWYSGATTPVVGPAVNVPLVAPRAERMRRMREHMKREEVAAAWLYFAAPEETASPTAAMVTAKTAKKAVRTFTNQDVERQNQQNGLVKYDNKTEKIQ